MVVFEGLRRVMQVSCQRSIKNLSPCFEITIKTVIFHKNYGFCQQRQNYRAGSNHKKQERTCNLWFVVKCVVNRQSGGGSTFSINSRKSIICTKSRINQYPISLSSVSRSSEFLRLNSGDIRGFSLPSRERLKLSASREQLFGASISRIIFPDSVLISYVR